MRCIQTVFCAGAVTAAVVAVGAERPELGQRPQLGLQPEKGKTYIFEVTAPQDASTLPARTTSEDPLKSNTGKAEQEENARKREVQRRADQAILKGNGPDTLHYVIDIADRTADEITLNVRVSNASASGSLGTKSTPAPGSAGSTESRGAIEVETPAFGVQPGAYTVKVDSLGQIRSCKPADSRREKQPAEGATTPPASARTLEKSSAEEPIHMQLQMILGTGLHGQDLVVGKSYLPAQEAAAPETSSKRTESEAAPARPKSGDARAPQVALKFEGTSREGEVEVARFSVVLPSPAGLTPSSARQEAPGQTAPPREARDSGETGSVSKANQQEEKLGEVTFRTTDGLIERGSAICPLSAKTAGEPVGQGQHQSLAIRRLTGVVRSAEGASTK